MAAPSLSAMFLIGADILRTTVSERTKSVLAQIGNVVGSTVDSDQVEWWQHVGFISRPRAAEKGAQAAQAFVVRRGDHDVAIASRDMRGQELAGSLQDGDTCVYATEGRARILLKRNGSIALYTQKDNDENGSGITIGVNADGSIGIVSHHGGISIGEQKITVLSAKGAGVEMSASGVAVIGSSVTLGGGLNPPSGVMTYYSALGGIVPALTAFAAGFTAVASAMAPIIAASTATPGEKSAANTALGAMNALAVAVTAAFSNPLTSYSKAVAATE